MAGGVLWRSSSSFSRRSTSDVSCCVFFANRDVRAVSSGDYVQIPWQGWHLVTCDENWRMPILWFSSTVAVYMWEAAKPLLFEGVKTGMSFCVAGKALPDILTCLQKCRKSFCLTGAIPLQAFQKMSCIFSGRRSTLETSIVILRDRRSTSDVSCCVFFANRNVRAASSGVKRNLHVAGVGHGESVILCGKCSV